MNILVVFAFALASGADAQQPLLVDVHQVPNMAFATGDGQYDGFEVRRVRHFAEERGFAVTFREVSAAEKLDGTISGAADMTIGAITVTLERERLGDFGFPHLTTKYLVVSMQPEESGFELFRRVVSVVYAVVASKSFRQLVLCLAVFILFGALLVALGERRAKPQGMSWFRWWGHYVWWSVATILQIEPGEIVPRRLVGRSIAAAKMLVYMIFLVVIISQSWNEIETMMNSAPTDALDLHGRRVATKVASTSIPSAQELGAVVPLECQAKSVEDAVALLAAGRAEAIVYDSVGLRQTLQRTTPPPGYRFVEHQEFGTQHYAAFFAENSPLLEEWNQVLLHTPQTLVASWEQLFFSH